MKNIFLSLCIALSAMVLIACGGGSGSNSGGSSKKVSENGFFGKLPTIIAEYHEAQAQLKTEEEKSKGKSGDAMLKAMKELVEKDNAIKKKLEEKLTAEESSLMNKELPVVNNNPAIEVAGLKISEINEVNVFFDGTITVKQALEDTWAKCQFQDDAGNVLQESNASIQVPYEFGAKGAKEGSYEISVTFEFPNPGADKLAKIVFIP